MADIWEIISSLDQPMNAVGGEEPSSAVRVLMVWLAYTSAVFFLGRLSVTVRVKGLINWCSAWLKAAGKKQQPDAQAELDELIAEVRHKIDRHSDSTRRLNEEINSDDHSELRKHAAATRKENTQFEAFLRDRCARLERRPRQRGDVVSGVIENLARHRRRAGEFGDALERFEHCDDLEAALSPLRERIEDLMDHNRRLQSELERTRKAVAVQSQKLEEAEEQARIDALTGLPNRRAFDEQIAQLHSRFVRAKTPYVVALMDIDHFKRFNDDHGHAIGDEVLRLVGQTLRDDRRASDHAARYGGEEFAILLPGITGHQAKFVIDRHRRQVEEESLKADGRTLSITASAGLAEVQPGDTIHSVTERADQALYAAKEAGRNQTCLEDAGRIVYFSDPHCAELASVR